MGILDSVGSVTKALDVGNYVKEAVDKVLPQNMHFVGDIAGAVTDYYTGNYIGAAKLGMDAMKDLPQAAKGAPQQTQAAKANAMLDLPNKKPALELSPPPTAKDPKSFDVNDLLAAIKALTAALSGHGAPAATPAGQSGTAAATTSNNSTATPATTHQKSAKEAANEAAKEGLVWTPGGPGVNVAAREAHRQAQAAASTPATTKPALAADHPAAASTAATSSAPTTSSAQAAKPGPTAKSESPTKQDSVAKTETPAKPDSAAATSAAPSSAKGQTISSVSQLQGMSDSAFMDAVRNGRISPDVAKDPTAMMAIQERMNDITQMNNLMTAMMRAIHDMQMAIVQNIRI